MSPRELVQDAAESTFLEHLPQVEKIVAFLNRKHGIAGADAEDLLSIVKLRLIENDYAILRKFRGESSLTTFLAVVIAGIFRDYRVQRWGRWRPSATASSIGPMAVRLETMLYRDGYSLSQAIQLLTSASEDTVAEKELRAIASRLPMRERMRPVEVGTDSLAGRPEEAGFAASENDSLAAERTRIEQALNEAIATLPPQERVLLKMKFWEKLSVADIARIVGVPQKQLYRRIDSIGSRLAAMVRAAGITNEDVRDLVHWR